MMLTVLIVFAVALYAGPLMRAIFCALLLYALLEEGYRRPEA